MRHFSRLLTTAVAVAVVAVPAAASAAAPPAKVGTRITLTGAGSIGALKIGISPTAAKKLLGKPDDSDRAGFSGKSSDLKLSYRRYGLTVHFFRGTQGGRTKLSGITITSSQFKTSKGIGVGSRVSQLQSAYGKRVVCFHGEPAAGGPFCNYNAGHAATPFFTKGDEITGIMLA
jgi:opacity protein-like surface antigen